MKTSSIIIRTQFAGLHYYAKAPEQVAYLRSPHRHVFFVEVEMQVSHDDRDLEFIIVKNSINEFIDSKPFDITASCEQMADEICKYLIKKYDQRNISCTVFEDNENGGRVKYEFI